MVQENSKSQCIPSIQLMFKRVVGEDIRRYNIPKSDQIAAVFTSENGLPPNQIIRFT